MISKITVPKTTCEKHLLQVNTNNLLRLCLSWVSHSVVCKTSHKYTLFHLPIPSVTPFETYVTLKK